MGLFGFLKKETLSEREQEKEQERKLFFASSEEFLQGEESDVIWSLVRDVIEFDYDFEKVTLIPKLEKTWASANTYQVRQIIPYCVYNGEEEYKLNAERLLKILESRGDFPNAAFCLSYFYLIGLFKADDNLAEAKKHIVIAGEQKSALANIDNKIKNLSSNVFVNDIERHINSFSPMALQMYNNEIYNTLSRNDVEVLRFVHTVAICWFTSLGYPESTVMVSRSIMLWKQEVASEQVLSNIFAKGMSHSCGEWMIKRMIKSAREGNTLAAMALKMSNIDYRKNYN